MKIRKEDLRKAVGRMQRELPDTDRDRYDRAYELGREGNVLTILVAIAGGLLVGLVLMWLMDPELGEDRRSAIARQAQAVQRVRPMASARTASIDEPNAELSRGADRQPVP